MESDVLPPSGRTLIVAGSAIAPIVGSQLVRTGHGLDLYYGIKSEVNDSTVIVVIALILSCKFRLV